MRDCPKAKAVWNLMHTSQVDYGFFTDQVDNWFIKNLEDESDCTIEAPWNVVFATTLWAIWQARNEECFNNSMGDHYSLLHKIKYHCSTHSLMSSADQLIERHTRQHKSILVGWEFPPPDWVKCNVGAALRDGGNRVACGGCFRNSLGRWMFGFSRRLGSTTINMAELWGIFTAIGIAVDKGISNLWIESDSKIAVDLVMKGCSDDHPCNQMVRFIRSAMQCHSTIILTHAFREANQVADKLASIGLHAPFGLHTHQDPPPVTATLLWQDVIGASFSRSVLL
ncbi:Ribonuclease H domain [Sesbania bispinosa]|nr:Ribonuclease H domain [Sesbania bispinosa]